MTDDAHEKKAAIDRRQILAGAALAGGAMALDTRAAQAQAVPAPPVGVSPAKPAIVAEDHWAQKGDVKLYLYRKRMVGDGPDNKPVVFLGHGSTFSGRGGFDLTVPGLPNYSVMDDLARRGFDVWTLDHENYGRSTRNTGTNSDIMSGVADYEAAFPVIEKVTGQRKIRVKGQSSGAIRAGVFAMRHPDRVERLILDAFTWHGKEAPEIQRRRDNIATLRASPTRPLTRATFQGIFTRDDPSTFQKPVPDALADYELALGNTAPSGTYIDMAVNMPMVDPTRIQCPVLMTRAEHDGNATEAELLDFFSRLPNKDKQFCMLRGVAHVAVLGTNRHRVIHAMASFLSLPDMRSA